MFAPFEPNIHCINVDLAHTEAYTGKMNTFSSVFKDFDNMEFHVLDGTDIYDEITKYLEANRIDLLAMVTRQRNFLEELFHFSKTKKMAYHANTPVLALKNKLED
jgi:nucleotide-binding universal stress UspA family protein